MRKNASPFYEEALECRRKKNKAAHSRPILCLIRYSIRYS